MSTRFINDQWRLPNAWNGSESNVNKQSNYSMDFDGSSQYISFTTPAPFNGVTLNNFDCSFSVWANFNAINQFGALVCFGQYNLEIAPVSSTRVGIWIYNSALSGVLHAPSLNTWYHYVMTKSGNTYSLYVDGVLIGSGTDSDNAAIGSSSFIGSNGHTSYFNGKLDGVAIFDYALSSSQVTTLYGSSSTGIGNPMSLSPKPVFYAPLGDQDAFNGSNYLVPNSSLKDYVFDFDGSNDYIDCGNVTSLNNLSAFSTSTWINYEGTISGASSHMFLSGGSASNNRFYVQLYSSNQIRYGYNGNTIVTTSSMSSGSWYNIVTVHNGTSLDVYLNGVKQNTSTVTVVAPSTNIGNSFQIGKYFALSSYYFNGQLSNAQIFNTALPATGSNSVETIYNNGSPLTSMSGFTSLVGWWKLDASATYDGTNWTIEDHAGTNDGTSSGMTQANLVASDLSFKTSISPFALDFDGVNDYINIPNSTDFDFGTADFTWSFWLNYQTHANNAGILYTGATSSHYRLKFRYSGQIIFLQNSQSDTQIADLGTNIEGTGWHHISLVRNSGTITTFLDGSQVDSSTRAGDINSGGNDFRIAYNNVPLNGQMSNVSIWNTALTSAQVTEIYNEGVPSNLNNHSAYSNLVSWWQLGSNSSFNTNWTVLDEKGSNNGTSVNMTEDDIVDGVGSYANGLSSGMGGDEVIGDAPYSTANALSVNMDVEDRVTDTPS